MSRRLRVERAEGLVTVQDRGRPGWAHLGVPHAGAVDAPAAALANRLVGNGPDAAVLEVTLGSLTARVSAATSVALTGAPGALRVDGRAVAHAEPVSAGAGAVVEVGRPRSGARSYLAVSGGITVEPVLGSRSTDTLAWVGPPPVSAGDVLPLGEPSGPRALDVPSPRPAPAGVRLRRGPRADWFGDDAWRVLLGTAWRVGVHSNRVGLRLEGPGLSRIRAGELASEGMVLGSVQVPPDGRPVVFLHDHPVTGGYPVIAVAEPDDLHVCAQLRPGETLRFRRG